MNRGSRRRFLAAFSTSIVGLAGCAASSTNTETPATDTESATATSTPTPATTSPTTTTTNEIQTTGPSRAGIDAFKDTIPEFLQRWNIPGASVSVMKNGRLVFTRGYGLGNKQDEKVVQPDSLFRIGSVSKSVTAVTILDLVEQGEISLDDSVFEILSRFLPDNGPADERVTETTVRQHLRHTAGWDLATIGFDPAFAPVRVAEAERVESPASADTTVRFLAKQELGSEPGSRFNYVNLGYIVLARVIEAVTGTNYGTYVRENILNGLGISRMEIGATQLDGLLEDEVRYYGHQTVESPYSGEQVPRPYGAFHLPTLDGAGGWVGSTIDLLRFVRGVNHRPATKNVLDTETLSEMTARPDIPSWNDAQQFYGMGWYVISGGRTAATLWHNGSLPGSYAFLIHSGSRDLTLAALFNSRSTDRQLQTFNTQTQQMLIETLGSVSTWPDRNLFNSFE